MKLGAIVGTARKPPRTVILRPADFADTWEGKPAGDVAIGLRLVAERDIDVARAEAAKRVALMYSDKDGNTTDLDAIADGFNDALMRYAVARATCRANDVAEPYFDMAEDTIGLALTGEAITRLWDELVLLRKGAASPMPAITDGELRELIDLLDTGALSTLRDVEAVELRKLLAHVHAALSGAKDDHG